MAAAAVLVASCSGAGSSPGSASSSDRQRPDQHPTTEQVQPEIELTPANRRASAGVIATGAGDAPYNYGPTVMADGQHSRMWWCSQIPTAEPAGDDIVYGSARDLDGPFTAGSRQPRAVFSGSRTGFDGKHTCDPSVIRVDGTYYLYYTGARGDHDFGNSIGLATSEDGVTWERANGGEPIVSPAHDTERDNAYGAGQPAAVYVDGWYYLMFTDTTGAAAGWNGAGQFLLRSPDPAFTEDVESLGHEGFEPVADTAQPRESSLADAFSADLVWVDVLDAFAVAHQTGDGTTLTFWDADFTVNPHPPVSVPGPWREGPGVVRSPSGHLPRSDTDPCGTVPVDVVRATQNLQAPTNLRRFGMDLQGARGCADADGARRMLSGFALPSPEQTMDVVVDGTVVRVERRSVATSIADHTLEERPEHVAELPVHARLPAGALVLHSPGNGTGVLLDDDRLARVRDEQVTDALTTHNGSSARTISDDRWESYRPGPTLG